MCRMIFKWPSTREAQENVPTETSLAVDPEGIPILHEVVDPNDLPPTDAGNPDQADLPLFDTSPEQSADPEPEPVNLDAVREALRNELLGVIEQTAAAVAERFRKDMEQTLKEELTRTLDERLLQSIYSEHYDKPE
jgi:hypothetical protein